VPQHVEEFPKRMSAAIFLAPMNAPRRRPTIAAILALVAILLRIVTPALHTCDREDPHSTSHGTHGCAHEVCRALERTDPPEDSERASAEHAHGAELLHTACAACGSLLLAPAFRPAYRADWAILSAVSALCVELPSRSRTRDIVLGGQCRAPPASQRGG
jgi:hypothetical protein